MDKRLTEEVPADVLGDEFKGYVFKITGGYDKDGFAMKQGVLLNHRVRLVLDGTTGLYRKPKRPGCRKRKSVRGCITGPDISVINLVIVQKGKQELPGLTDPASDKPSLRGPKRASNIRKLWNLSKEDDVRQFVTKRKVMPKNPKTENPKPYIKSPKIQRLVTPRTLQHKKRRIALKKRRFEKNQKEASEYAKIINQIRKDKRQSILSKRRSEKSERTSLKKENVTAATKPDVKEPSQEKRNLAAEKKAKQAAKGAPKTAAADKTAKTGAGQTGVKAGVTKTTGKKTQPKKQVAMKDAAIPTDPATKGSSTAPGEKAPKTAPATKPPGTKKSKVTGSAKQEKGGKKPPSGGAPKQ